MRVRDDDREQKSPLEAGGGGQGQICWKVSEGLKFCWLGVRLQCSHRDETLGNAKYINADDTHGQSLHHLKS